MQKSGQQAPERLHVLRHCRSELSQVALEAPRYAPPARVPAARLDWTTDTEHCTQVWRQVSWQLVQVAISFFALGSGAQVPN